MVNRFVNVQTTVHLFVVRRNIFWGGIERKEYGVTEMGLK